MSEDPDLFQFLSHVRHQLPMILVPISHDGAESGAPEVVIPAVHAEHWD